MSFFWSNVAPSSSDPDQVNLHGDSTGSVTTLRMQQGDGLSNIRFWGPEFGFARTLWEAGQRDLLVIKASRGGGGNTFWRRETGHMYRHVIDSVRTATDALSADGHEFTIRGLLWVQGESDSPAEASVADLRLEELLDNLREDLPRADRMYAVLGCIAASGGSRARRQCQAALAARSADFEYFSNLDLADRLYDGLHFDRDAKLLIGQRFAGVVLARSIGPDRVLQADFDAVAALPESTSVIFEDWVPDENGAPNGVVHRSDGPFLGFVEGRNGAPSIGLVVEGSSGQVVFADYRSAVATADIAAGPFGNPAFPDSGDEVTLGFVDPRDPSRPATVEALAIRYGATNQDDRVSVAFEDAVGREIWSTATVSAAAFGQSGFVFQRAAMSDDPAPGGIHSVRLRTNGPQGELWALGSFDDQSEGTVDLIFAGFEILQPAGRARPGDGNLDGAIDVSDAVHTMTILFLDAGLPLPCDEDGLQDPSHRVLFDVNDSGTIDLSDAVHLLQFLFQGGSPPALGEECVELPRCPESC